MKKSLLWFIVLLVCVSLISTFSFIGCKEEATSTGEAVEEEAKEVTVTEETPAAESATINVSVLAGWVTTDGLIPAIQNKLADEVEVVIFEGDGGTLQDTQLMAGAGGTGEFDAVLAWEALMPLMVQYLDPLDDYLVEAGINIDDLKARFYPTVIDQITSDGKIYWIPIHVNSQLGYARADLFTDPDEQAAFKTEYGYDLPQPNEVGAISFKDREEFRDVAKFFTRDTDNDGETDLWGYAPAGQGDHGECVFIDLLFRSGLEYFDSEGHSLWGPAHPENQEKVIELATWMQDLVQKDKSVSPGTTGMQMTEVNQIYKEGKAAMSFTWNVDFWGENTKPEVMEAWNDTKPLSWSIDFMNTEPENKGLMSIIGYGLSKDSKNKEATVKFLLKALDEELRKDVHSTVGLPCGSGQIELTDWLVENNLTPGGYVDAITSVGSFWPVSKTPWTETSSAREVARPNLEKLLSGSITPEEFVKITGDAIEQIMKDAGHF